MVLCKGPAFARNCFNPFLPQSFSGNLNSETGSDFLLDLKLNLHSGTQQELTLALVAYSISSNKRIKIIF